MKRSAGILLYRFVDGTLQVLLAHPGGPFWARKDAGVWTIPKGEFEDEDALAAARREFAEETGSSVDGDFVALTPCMQKNGKRVQAFAVEGDLDTSAITSNQFEMEWPPGSGKRREFPEIDRAEWFTLEAAREKINPAQQALLVELRQKLNGR
jgi:predicted NUDIX family NTP pyrophosphohydrolase